MRRYLNFNICLTKLFATGSYLQGFMLQLGQFSLFDFISDIRHRTFQLEIKLIKVV